MLKHKFIRMAKKTSYLTELIERHERWKAEGGDRLEEPEETQDRDEDLSVVFIFFDVKKLMIYRSTAPDPEDLWDFDG